MTVRAPRGRNGLTPTRVVLPHDPVSVARFATVLAYLRHRFAVDADEVEAKLGAGDVVDRDGQPLTERTPYIARSLIYVHRDLPVEPEVPFSLPILHRDENLLVVDKPHFLATTPRGAYVARSALVRLRRELELPDLAPAHRLDRVTAGVLVCTLRPEVRGAYQELFARREVRKVYEAVAGIGPERRWPVTVRSRIVKERGVLRAYEVPGEPNAESRIDLMETDERRGLARYRLEPHTGKTHQLRLHMAGLGLPILNDAFYPDFYEVDPQDYSRPLQLVARSVEFIDPLSDRPHRFTTDRPLSTWWENRLS